MESYLPSSKKSEDTMEEENARHIKKLDLQEEIEMLQGDLEREQSLNRILKTALQGPAVLPPSECSLIPRQVLLAELVLEEEQIITLERKVKELKLNMYQETKRSRKWDLQLRKKQLQYNDDSESDRQELQEAKTQNDEQAMRKGKKTTDKMTFSGSILGRQNPSSSAASDEESLYCILPKRKTPKVAEGNNIDVRRWLPKLTYLNLSVTR